MERIFILHRTDAGLGDCIVNAGNAWLFAKKHNCNLLIAWCNFSYLEIKNLNAFTHYFDVPDEIEGVRLK